MSLREPRFGFTRHGLAVHAHVADHHPDATAYQRLNKRLAVWLTTHVGTMTCFWAFSFLALLSLPATLVLANIFHAPKGGFIAFYLSYGFIFLITWVCQNYIQLVLLPGLMVGQSLQNQAADARAAKQFEDLEEVRDWLDLRTQGGLTEVLNAVGKLGDQVANLADTAQQVMAARVEHESGVAADAKRAANAAEGAFVATQALAAVATAKPGPGELAAAVRENTEAVQQVHQAVTAVPEAPDPGPAKSSSDGGKAP